MIKYLFARNNNNNNWVFSMQQLLHIYMLLPPCLATLKQHGLYFLHVTSNPIIRQNDA